MTIPKLGAQVAQTVNPLDPGNLFEVSSSRNTEQVFALLEEKNFKIERIVSHGHASATDFWYDQENPEWVVLLEGSATLEFENKPPHAMQKGDYLLLPARLRHRVQRVSPDAVWLVVHFRKD